jgi:hypothetical protein
VPLGYNEVYEPPFRASRDYLRAANLTNTHLGRESIDRYIERRQSGSGGREEHRYANASVPGAYTEVSRETFTAAQPVGRNRLRADPGESHQASFSTNAPDMHAASPSPGRRFPPNRIVTGTDRPVAARSVPENPAVRQRGGEAAAGPQAQRSARPTASPEYSPDQRGPDRPGSTGNYETQRRYAPPPGVVRESPQAMPQSPAMRVAPPVREAPMVREAPAVREAPPAREAPMVREAPVVRQAPVVHQAPVVREAPAESHPQHEPDRRSDRNSHD